ncbi:MAG: hypothetical protein ACRDTH_09200 [Pseudonocardiaceae bacterium]
MAVEETPVQAGSSTELPPAVAMRQLTMGALVSQAISVIARFGVADTLAAGPRQVGEIAELVGAHGPAPYRLLQRSAMSESSPSWRIGGSP